MAEKLYQDKAWLYKMHWEQGKSLSEMARIARCSMPTISDWMRKHGIAWRSLAEATRQKHAHALYRDAGWLRELYWAQGKSPSEMAKVAKCSAATILDWMERLDVPRRTNAEANRQRDAQRACYRDRAWLYEMYWKEGKSTCEMAETAGCSDATIWRWMKKLNIPTRSHKDPEYRERYLERWREYNRRLGLKKRNLGEMTCIESICHAAFEALNLGFTFEKFIHPYRVDFFFPSHGVIVEAMGEYWHNRPKQRKHDTERKAFLEASGYTVLEWWGPDIKADVYKLIDEELLPLLDQPSRMERPPRGVSRPYRGPHGWQSAIQLSLFDKEPDD